MRWITTLLISAWPLVLLADQVPIPTVEKMPPMPQPFVLRDWKKVARDFDALAFDFTKEGDFLPLPWWDNGRKECDITGFGLPAYIGSYSQTPEKNNYDAITCLGAVLGATKMGIDKSKQNGTDWVRMLNIYYSHKNGTHLYMNNPGARTGQTFWYELLPSVLFYQIHEHYPNQPGMRDQFKAIAERWHGGCLALGAGENSVPDFDHTSLDLNTGKPLDNPRWREPDAAAAVAWLEYMAHVATGEQKYRQAADWAMQFLARREQNPFYECLLPYGAYASARMNAELKTDYPTGKLVNWVFDGSNPRKWGVIAEKWGDTEANGLMGSVYNKSEYAFAMNSFLAPAAMIPIVRYDERFARDLAKWLLHVAVNSRFFYPNAWKPEQQTSWQWASTYDKNSCIAYEGLRKQGMRRERPSDPPRPEILRPDGQGIVERTWNFHLPEGNEHILVLELEQGEAGVPRPIAVSTASSKEGPWTPAFTFKPGDKNHRWAPIHSQGPLWVRLSAEPAASAKPIVIENLYVQSRLAMSPQASGDPLFVGWGRTDLGLYGSAFVGMLAAMIEPTNVESILQIDCRATESFAAPSYPSYLLYNPYESARKVQFKAGPKPVDIYDTVSNQVLARGVEGTPTVTLQPQQAVVLVLCPAGAALEKRAGHLEANGVVVDYSPQP